MSNLYLVATPIGNLEDISQRALRILGEVNLIAAEDTRRTRQLLAAYGIRTPLTSYYEHNKESKLPHILERLDREDIALVSDAGMPGISDPGYDLVRAAVERGIPVVAVPGPSVLPTALAVSGLPANQFIYIGFLPRKKGDRKKLLGSISTEPRTIVALETPHRLLASLRDVEQVLGDRKIAVCRELTKLHEEVFRSSISQAIMHFSQPKGEFTLVIEGSSGSEGEAQITESVLEEIRKLRREGIPAREAVTKLVAATGLPRNLLYKAWLELP
ncbi:MAG: 16S rRNA (cytidine(1402)-2'-O)-methyltransferase [Dehalococcoidia bacterium]|nr:MAG: 16S rRNA (cytidine(1402)-2'-O)-methyltransferase [Dehalococcoidia bacterium]